MWKRHRGCVLGSPRGACPLSHSREQYSVKMGDLSVYETVMSVVVPVKKIISYPQFSTRGAIRHDLALLQLVYPVKFTMTIQPVCIPQETFKVEDGARCWVTGWGRKEEFGETARQEANGGRGRQPFPWTRQEDEREGRRGGLPGRRVRGQRLSDRQGNGSRLA